MFVDINVLYNNPSQVALAEARKLWINAKTFFLVSIGTCLRNPPTDAGVVSLEPNGAIPFIDRLLQSIPGPPVSCIVPSGLSALKMIAEKCIQLNTNAAFVHELVLRESESWNPDCLLSYHRFHLERDIHDVGFEDWRKIEEITGVVDSIDDKNCEEERIQCARIILNQLPLEGNCIFNFLGATNNS